MIKKKLKRIIRKSEGITLIALIITIVVIIILATITINFAFGDNGLINMAEEARDLAANSTDYESNARANLVAYMNEYIAGLNGGSTGGGTEDPTTPDSDPLPTDGSFNADKGVNTPHIGDNMKLVEFNDETLEWVPDEMNDSYNYIDTSESGKENTSEWANAVVTKNGVESYFVWIPRYAYKITYYTDENKTTTSSTPTAYGTIDIKFINGTGNIAADGVTVCKYANDSTLNPATDYIIHPAFTTDENYGGGWSKELAGIWIGKFEAARSDSEGTTQGSATIIKTQPGVTSFRSITIGEMYTNAYNYARELESHMLKNSEWGAVAYLTESKYGRNGTEVTPNTDSTFLTGGGEGNAYATTNTKQSSTGNVYGIYDLNIGAIEYVAGYLKNGDFSEAESTFTDNTSDAYSTAYDEDNQTTGYKYGDATYETSRWHFDSALFVNSSSSFFVRGRFRGTSDVDSGIFVFNYAKGNAGDVASFRLALVM